MNDFAQKMKITKITLFVDFYFPGVINYKVIKKFVEGVWETPWKLSKNIV